MERCKDSIRKLELFAMFVVYCATRALFLKLTTVFLRKKRQCRTCIRGISERKTKEGLKMVSKTYLEN